MSRRSALLARLVGALRSKESGAVYVGPIFNGFVWDDQRADPRELKTPIGFSGTTTLENGVLTIDFTLTGHDRLRALRAEISNGGLAGAVHWTDAEAGTIEESW